MILLDKINSGYNFTVRAESGEALLNSVTFSDKKEVETIIRGLTGIKKNHTIFERKTNHEGEFLFYVKNSHGMLIGQSQLYNSEAGMENGINNLRIILASL